jgi:copper resistance protein D
VELVLRIVHLLAAIVWVGGTVALVFVSVPLAQRLEGPARGAMLRELGRRWRPIGWSALGVAIATGAWIAGIEHAFDTTPTRFDVVLAVKGGLVGLLVAGAYLHDYVLGPGLARQIREGKPQSLRPILVRIGRLNLAVTVVLPILGAVLSEFLHD